MNTPDSGNCLLYAAVSVCWVVSIGWLVYPRKSTIPAIPGSDGFLSSYLTALRLFYRSREILGLGYNQDRNGVFRVPRLFRWEYVVNGRKRVLELADAPEHVLSVDEPVVDLFQTDYTVGSTVRANPYHIAVVRGPLTRNLARCFPRVQDEIVHAFDHVLGLHDTEWKLLQIWPASLQIVARTSNRLYVDLPICREPEYLQLCIDYTTLIFIRGQMIGLLPKVLRPILGPLLSTRKQSLRRAMKFLGPLIDERLEQENQYGSDWPGRPNDVISWLLDFAEGEERTTPALTLRVLALNAVAIHTSSMTFTNALFDLTAYPDHIVPMREEAERVVAGQGWTKTSLSNMHKIDSFIRESMRLNTGPVIMLRKVLAKDGFTFSDGTKIPYGSFLGVSTDTHQDPENYDNADVFDGFRFSRLREERHAPVSPDTGGTGIFKSHMVSTATDHIVFGHGHHACPGRFFAATEIKAMLAHILINYDMKAETDIRPKEICIAELATPNPQGKIWIRKRGSHGSGE